MIKRLLKIGIGIAIIWFIIQVAQWWFGYLGRFQIPWSLIIVAGIVVIFVIMDSWAYKER